MPRFNKIIRLMILSLFVAGCASFPFVSEHKSSEIAKVWVNQTDPIEILGSYQKENELYVKYNTYLKDSDQEKTFFTKASWSPETVPFLDLSKQIVVPLKVIGESEWEQEIKGLASVKDCSEEQWGRYKGMLTEKLTPQGKEKGNVVTSGDEDLFFYYDGKGDLNVVPLRQKPKNFVVDRIYNQRDLAKITIEVLKSFLKENDIKESRVLFATKGEFYCGQRMLYIDTDRNLSLALKVFPEEIKGDNENLLSSAWKTTDHLVLESHVFGIAKRPVSSLYSLFVKSKNTAYEVIKAYTPNFPLQKKTDQYSNGLSMDLDVFDKKLNYITKTKPYKGTMDFLIGGDEFFPRLIDTLIGAKDSIQIRIFIFDRDDYAVKIADILKKKSNEGVDVKILLDGIGEIMGKGKTPETLPPGFVQPQSIISYLRKDSKVKVRIRPNTWFNADHTKTIMIDNEVCFTGGMNIGREYRYDWHDLMIEVRGPILKKIKQEFKLAWAHSGPFGDLGYFFKKIFHGRERKKGAGYDIRLLFTKSGDPQIYKAQLLAIREAKKYIYISNAYFSDKTILDELINARKRGVDVRVVLPIHGNHEIMNANNVVKANIMYKNGIKVYFYPGMSHIKAAIYDGWLCTGSANFDRLSLMENLEMDLATSNKETVDSFKKALFESDFKRSKMMTSPLESGWGKWLGNILANHL